MERISSYVEQIRGVSYKPEDVVDSLDETSIVLLRANNIRDGQINFDDVIYVKKNKVSDKQILQKGDILICASSGSKDLVGKAAQVERDINCTFGAFCKVVRPKGIHQGFLGMYFQSNKYRRTISQASAGANINNIKNEDIDSLELDVPNDDNQEEIYGLLSKVNYIICARKVELAELDNLIKSRFVELFDTDGYPKVPISKLVVGKVQSVKKVFSPSDEIKYIDISSIDNKRNVMTGYTEYVLSEAPSRAQQHIKTGDIVISTVRPNLRNVAMTEFEDDNLVASSGFCVLRATKCLPEYLLAIVCSDKFTDDMTKVVTGANYPAIKDSDVMNYQVAMPPIKLQKEFAEFVHQVDKLKFEVQKSLDETQQLMDSLMQQYFG